MKAFRQSMIAMLVVLASKAGSAGESAQHVIYIRVLRPNVVSIQRDAGSTLGPAGPGVTRYRLNWNLGSVSRKLTVSSNPIDARPSLECHVADESAGRTEKSMVLSEAEREVVSFFMKTSGSMQVEHGYLPAAMPSGNETLKPMVTYTVTDI
ncbi:MAG TPA: hypothetical protein VGB38_05610 [bacterium]